MRTRSQPISPGGFASLDNNSTPRRARSTRSASKSSAKEPSSQPESSAERASSAEPASSSQPAATTRKRGTRASKKTTTTSASTDASASGPSTTTRRSKRSESREPKETREPKEPKKAPQRGTRRSTRKTDKQTSGDEDDAAERQRTETTSPENPIPPHELPTLPESPEPHKIPLPESPEPASPVTEKVLKEPNADSESPKFSSVTQEPPAPEAIPKDLPITQKDPSTPPRESQENDKFDIPQCLLALEGISDVGSSPLSVRSKSPSLEPDEALPVDLELDDILIKEIEAALAIHDHQGQAASPDAVAPVVPEVASGTSGEESASEQAGPVQSEHQTIVEVPEQPSPVAAAISSEIDALADQLGKLSLREASPEFHEGEGFLEDSLDGVSLAEILQEEGLVGGVSPREESPREEPLGEACQVDQAVVLAEENKPEPTSGWMEAPMQPTASIYDDAPPAYPYLPLLESACRGPVVEPPRSTIFRRPIEVGPSSIYEDWPAGSVPPNVSGGHPIVEEQPRPRTRATTPQRSLAKRRFVVDVLSPIAEEPAVPSPGSEMSWVHAAGGSPVLEEPKATSSADFSQQGMTPCGVSPLVFRGTGDSEESAKASRWVPHEGPDVDKPHRARQRLTSQPDQQKKKKKTKRARSDSTEEEGSATPSTKRRNLGPPGSTPFTRRRSLVPKNHFSNNAVPYSERLRRRKVEREGRIHRTLFRLPQLLAQEEADRQAAESSPESGPCPEAPQPTFDFRVERAEPESEASMETTEPRQTPTPSTPQRRGWNIRGLINSVPRSFSRLFAFGRSNQSSEEPSVPQPSSERITRHVHSKPEPASGEISAASRRRRSDQQPNREMVDLSYELFPPPRDYTLYLPPPPLPEAPYCPNNFENNENPSVYQVRLEKLREAEKAEKALQEKSQTPAQTKQTKRKRAPSPDQIPNPKGCSYGMDLDYFCYSSESEDETETGTEQPEPSMKASTLAKSAVRSALRSERPSKKVRFDSSPQDTPSKLRARATDPYTGRHFIGMGVSAQPSEETTPASATASPPSPTPQRPPGFIPNPTGTFSCDFDYSSDEDEADEAPSPASVSSSAAPSLLAPRTEAQESALSPAPRPTPRQAPLPATPAKVDKEALAKVRSQAEKYKPKTPSGLRTASRYSSPIVATPDTVPVVPAKEPVEKFGDDEFARDAEWLYENCPSGDLQQLKWPARHSLVDSLGVSPEALQIVNDNWDQSEVDEAYKVFRQSLNEFVETLS